LIIIASARYIDGEMASELGMLPPCFLPVGNRRLYEYQVEIAKKISSEIIITLPTGFSIPEYDDLWFKENHIDIKFTDTNLELGSSILQVLHSIDLNEKPLGVLFGDSLFDALSIKMDTFFIGNQDEFYPWGVVRQTEAKKEFINSVDAVEVDEDVIAGWFLLSSAQLFSDKLKGKSFFSALNEYLKVNDIESIFDSSWMDFGHLHTYFRSKARRTTERSFNSLTIEKRIVTKRSRNDFKLRAEANWFASLPEILRLYTPIYLGSNDGDDEFSYSTEYLYLSTLSELFVHGLLPNKIWMKIFDSCYEYLSLSQEVKYISGEVLDFNSFLFNKNNQRFEQLSELGLLNVSKSILLNGEDCPSLTDIYVELTNLIMTTEPQPNCMHGDFCFSNILYDFRVNSIKLIDPRGMLGNSDVGIFGDLRYDLAKYYHSIVGFYDFIISGRYHLTVIGSNEFEFNLQLDSRCHQIKDVFMSSKLSVLANRKEVFSIMILLFISMVPLHNDDKNRQLAMILNAYRLYLDYKKAFK